MKILGQSWSRTKWNTGPKAEYVFLCIFSPHVGIVRSRPLICSPLHKLNSQKVFFTVLSSFSNKTINYKTKILKYLLNTEYFLTIYQTLYQQSTIFGHFWDPLLESGMYSFCTNKCSLAEQKRLLLKHKKYYRYQFEHCECYNKCINRAVVV